MATVNFGGYTLPVYDAASLTWGDPKRVVDYFDNGQVNQDYWSAPSLSFGGQYDPSIGMYSNRDNWLLEPGVNNFFEPGSRDTFTGMLKTGDKEGTRFRYALQDGQYVPVEALGTQPWDTNSRLMSQFALAGLGIAGGGYLSTLGNLGGTAGGMAAGEGAMIGEGLTSVADLAAAGSSIPTMTTYGVLDTSMALPGTTFTPGNASLLNSLGSSISNYVTNPKNIPTLIKAGSMIGGLLGDSGGSSGGGGAPKMNPVPAPTMYGQGATSGGSMGGSWGPMGPTETERRMRQEYLPGLLGNGPWNGQSQALGMSGLGSFGAALRNGTVEMPTTVGLGGARPLDVPPIRRGLLGGY